MTDTIHSCSAFCTRPGCLKLREALDEAWCFLHWYWDKYPEELDEESDELCKKIADVMGWEPAIVHPKNPELFEKRLASAIQNLDDKETICIQHATITALQARIAELERDAARYLAVRRGQKWSVVDGIGNHLRAEALDAAIDAAIRANAPKGTM